MRRHATPSKASDAPRSETKATLGLLAVCLILSGVLAYTYNKCAGGSDGGSSSAASWASNGISESSSGALFRAVRTRKFTGKLKFASWTPPREKRAKNAFTGGCKNWAVTTTIFPPTTTVKQIAALPGWCLVIAGDKKTPKVYNVSGGAVYLSPADQDKLPFATGSLLRWNHFGRKNLGFLYAISRGARWVYDTDDDNELQTASPGIPLPRANAMVDEVDTASPLYNLYPQMSTAPSAWPRGFPLEAIKDNQTYAAKLTRRAWSARRVGVFQSLADHDPDVDGIYRLTQPLPFTFHATAPQQRATLHAYDALWSLLLPCTVHGRVTDIWRAYIAQRLLWDIGYRIAFSTPWVTQYRNVHNYLADFNSELPLYQQAGELARALAAWQPTSPSLPGRLEEAYVLLYEMSILGYADVLLAQAWLSDLVAINYRFPPLQLEQEAATSASAATSVSAAAAPAAGAWAGGGGGAA